jgi:NADH-quinone oxidoreductase subunit J
MSTKAVIRMVAAALASIVMLIAAPAFAEAVLAEAGDASLAPEGALGNSPAAALIFWALALGTLGGAVFVITRRNLVAAVMGLVFTFFAVAALYAMLYAHFLAVLQVLVYAGAIMVLFVFVIMILNKPEDEPWALDGLLGKVIAGGALGYFVLRLGGVLWDVKDTPAAAAAQLAPGTTVESGDFGSVAEVGRVLFTDYLFAFEAISVILLSAVVGAIAIARPGGSSDEDGEDDAAQPQS